MMAYRRYFEPLSAAFMLLALGAIWLIFAPVPFGGQASYVIVSGSSMEPGFHRGDLVILRTATDYQIGDIVTYRHPQIGPVIHRIVAREADRFVFKGDNNTWLDLYHPSQADLIGTLWVHLPSVGKIVEQLRTPHNLAIFAAVIGVVLMATVTSGDLRPASRRARRRISPVSLRAVFGGWATHRQAIVQPQGGRRAPSVLGASKESLLFVLAALGFASLLLMALAFTRPTLRTTPQDIIYTQGGEFSYSAAALPGVYDSNSVQTGDTIFRRLAERVSVNFSYHLTSNQPADVHGTYLLLAEIGDGSGWRRTIELQPETRFDGDAFTASTTIDLSKVQALIDSFEKETALQRQQYTLAVTPDVGVEGVLAGHEFRDALAPRLEFRLDSLQMQLVRQGGEALDPLRPSKQGLLKENRSEPNTISLLGLTLTVARARSLALSGLALTISGGLGLGLALSRAMRGDEAARIQFKYGSLLLSIRDCYLGTDGQTIQVATIDDLVKLAERQGQMILHQVRDGTHDYFVQDSGVTYHYQPTIHDEQLMAVGAARAVDRG